MARKRWGDPGDLICRIGAQPSGPRIHAAGQATEWAPCCWLAGNESGLLDRQRLREGYRFRFDARSWISRLLPQILLCVLMKSSVLRISRFLRGASRLAASQRTINPATGIRRYNCRIAALIPAQCR